MAQPLAHTPFPLRSIMALAAVAGCSLFGTSVMAQPTPTTGCAYNAGNQLTVGTSCSTVAFNKPGSGNTNTITPTTCGGSNNYDWFGWFTATAGTTVITYTNTTNNTNPILHLYTGACGSLTEVDCANNGGDNVPETITHNTTPGTDYLIRIQRSGSNSEMDGTICVWSPPPPANDEPCGATLLAVNTSCSNTSTTSLGATSSVSVPDPPCGNYAGRDVWYRFVATANRSVRIRTSANGLTDTGVALYEAATCSTGFNLLGCSADGNGLMGELGYGGLTEGATYYVRVWGEGALQGSFDICLISINGDEPCAATPLTMGTSCSTTSGNTSLATPTSAVPDPSCGSYSGNDVWYSFVAPLNGTVTVRTAAGGLTNSALSIYAANACSGTFTEVVCATDGNGAMAQVTQGGLVPGTVYYVRVWREAASEGSFTICVWSPLTNNTPCSAAELPLGSDCSMALGHNVGATATTGIPNPGCASYIGADVWYRFTAPEDPKVTFRTTAGSLNNIGMAVYSATACNGTFTLIACDNLNGPGNMPFLSLSELELVPGEQYYLRVWRNNSTTGGTFNLCAFTAPDIGDCVYVLRMFDLQGDGWGASSVTVQVGNAAPQTFTLSNGDRDVAYIPVNIGNLVTVTYNAVGGGQNEINYLLQQNIGLVFADGPNPTNGLVYAAVADCSTPPTAQSDCIGSHTICSAQSVVANPSNTGLTEDLNVTNRGCLLNDERQGLWFNFSPSADGTVAFTIAPNNPADDYDFAVYGPYGGLTCPPGAPLRCNYSATVGNTGLSTASNNASQGASGSPWSSALTVAVGETYLLYVSNWSRSGLAFQLTWQLTNGASLDCTVLPVDLLAFDGEAVPQGARLHWSTASERNSDRFVVERAGPDGDYRPIGEVNAAGDSHHTVHYAFLDEQPLPGLNLYRLHAIDRDGQRTITHTVPLTFRRTVGHGLPYPNPARETIHLDLFTEEEADVDVAILDASGRVIRNDRVHVGQGRQVYQAPLGGLAQGIYMLTVRDPDGETTNAGRFVVD